MILCSEGGGGGTTNPFAQGGVGGGTGQEGYSYRLHPMEEESMMQMKPNGIPDFPPSNPFREDAIGEALFKYNKGSPITSPDLAKDYDSIKTQFKVRRQFVLHKRILRIYHKW